MLKGRNLINPDDLNVDEIYEIIELARKIVKSPHNYSNVCNGRILGTLFLSLLLEPGLVSELPCFDWVVG